MKNIWRINCKPGEQLYSQKNQFEFWIKEEIIAIGWSTAEGCTENLEDKNYTVKEIKDCMEKLHYEKKWKTKSFKAATNIFVERMEIGDYIWLRCGNTYKLGKIKSECFYNLNSKDFEDKRQIGFYRKVEYLNKDFSESEVPGKIVASYRARNTVQVVEDYNNIILKYCQSIFSGVIYKINIENWNTFLHSSDIEEIVGLYLQVEKGLYVYTSTNKKDTAEIEFELVDKLGNLYGIQVKSGNTSINALDYIKISQKMKIYLFAANDNIINLEGKENIEKIDVKTITEFIKHWKHILPKRIKIFFE